MANGEVRKVSLHDIHVVQNLIERCLKLYMSHREVVHTLYHQAKIEPGFTELVWQKLEAENQEFFRAYDMKLTVKDQILRFNEMLEKQVEVMQQITQNGSSLTPQSNGSQTQHSTHSNSAHRDPRPHMPSITSENMHHTNGSYSLQQLMQVAANMPRHDGRMDFHPPLPMVQNSNAGAAKQGFNERKIKTEGVHAGNSALTFISKTNYAESHNAIRETSIAPFNGRESCSQSFNESVMETEMNSFGVDKMTQNFNLTGLTADSYNSTDLLQNYSRSPYVGTNRIFLDPYIREEDQDYTRTETMSEDSTYKGFGTD
ncbi:uncharacterized protein LOC121746936 isoform X1 [Salvia splendens]|uniref:uncharacterized protein LOC121746936 isoform X1 n=2 Tax=Salvia splendens TaxID=180675 RepID=UPI001C25D6E5|nr:uncharacterized protein LOC121746936 isoform X1 [Salvia splendens]XP_041996831.1 uncharacterized protein LOC121746936 isoform X1 [Salvia splendens]